MYVIYDCLLLLSYYFLNILFIVQFDRFETRRLCFDSLCDVENRLVARRSSGHISRFASCARHAGHNNGADTHEQHIIARDVATPACRQCVVDRHQTQHDAVRSTHTDVVHGCIGRVCSRLVWRGALVASHMLLGGCGTARRHSLRQRMAVSKCFCE